MVQGNKKGTAGRGGSGQGGGRGMGRGGGRSLGPDGECVCPSCGATVPHQKGQPCYSMQCPACGSNMTRKS